MANNGQTKNRGRRLLRIAVYVPSTLLLLAALGYGGYALYFSQKSAANLGKLGPEASTIELENFRFRDLNKNGTLDAYEDSRLAIDKRIEDLLARMTLAEKAGLMFIPMLAINKDGSIAERPGIFNPLPTSEAIASRLLNHFNIIEVTTPALMVEWHNTVQKLAERTRLGIPVTIASDPRHAFSKNPMASAVAGSYSLWPEPIGLAATGDMQLIRRFGDIARQEYLATGIRLALHPTADLATEPRWGRINHTFGEDAELAARSIAAYIAGFQGELIGTHSVITMSKHFPGGGPQKDGADAHFEHGKEQVYPGGNFDYHLRPFEAAFAAGTGQIMPYYGQPIGLEGIEAVGFGFNKDVITGLLREKYNFDGVVCTDWGLFTDSRLLGFTLLPARAWGVEELTIEQRMRKAVEAGVDQFGGEYIPEVLIELVQTGQLTESRLDQSVRRLLRDKFRLGLFENPYLDLEHAVATVGNDTFRAAGELAQRKAYVLLKNRPGEHGLTLPLEEGLRLYVEGIDPLIAGRYGVVVESVDQADVAILRLDTPYETGDNLIESFFHTGDLDFKEKEKKRLMEIIKRIPTVVDIYLERPAVIPEIAEHSAGLLANFGAEDTASLDVIFGKHHPTGQLPFELPASMEAVRQQKEDMPYDSDNPLFPFGFGLRYSK